MAKPQNVDEYLAAFSDPAQAQLRELRKISRDNAPRATEGLKWGNPAYSLDVILFMFAGYQKHANFAFTPSTREAFRDELTQFRTGKGSVQLPYDKPLPSKLLANMIAYRIREFEVDGVLWM